MLTEPSYQYPQCTVLIPLKIEGEKLALTSLNNLWGLKALFNSLNQVLNSLRIG